MPPRNGRHFRLKTTASGDFGLDDRIALGGNERGDGKTPLWLTIQRMRRVLEALFRPSSGLNGIFLVLAEIVSDPAAQKGNDLGQVASRVEVRSRHRLFSTRP